MQRGDRRVAAASYVPCIEPARLTLNVLDPDGLDALLARVQSRLDADAAPAVTIDRLAVAVRFTAQTWRPILVSRITDALEAELGLAGRQARFSALG